MKITKVKFYEVEKGVHNNFLAKCSIVLDDAIVLHDIRIFNGKKGRYVVMPGRNVATGNRIDLGEDLFHPVKRSCASYISDVVIEGYRLLEEKGQSVYRP